MMRMIDFDTLFTIPPYALKKIEKEQLHKQYLDRLFEHHCNACKPYQQIVRVLGKSRTGRGSCRSSRKKRTGAGGSRI